MTLERPIIAIAALVIFPLAIALARRLGSPFTASVPLGPPGGAPFKAPYSLTGIIKTLYALEYCGVFLLFIGASGPVMQISETVWLNRGADILFVLDISPSMAAIDMDGSNRFNAARRLLKDFADRRPSDGIGLVAAGNDAALLIPPTTDRGILAERLESLRIGEMGNGTALGMGIAIAAYHLEKSKAPRKAVVLISDGENNAGAIHPETAAAMLKEINASLWVIGVGSGGEVPIDYVDPFTKMRRAGVIDSRYDKESLARIAASAGGTWIQAPSSDAFAAAFARVDDQEMLVRRSSAVTRKRPFHKPFILAALALIAASRFVRRFFLGAWL
ncbi:MAG: VWA domain-containing protein [Treponema sp.]|jgi:Ca-activated chloride channel family protein|nr:VWA domain-containing protein [Treponema sp.]